MALLRGINVLGRNALPMAELAALLQREGFADVRTYVQSGNVVFRSTAGSANSLASRIGNPTLAQIGAAHGCSAAAVALAWVIRGGNVIAIPESGNPAHVKENAVALSLALAPRDLQALDAAFPGPLGAT